MSRRRNLGRDVGGGALVEFALFLPLLLLVLIGFAEGLQLVEAQRRMSRAASTIGDLAAQARTLSSDDLGDIFVAGQLVVEPMPTASLGMRLMGFSANDAGVVSKNWSVNAATGYAGTAPEALPAGYAINPNQGVVIADVSYVYKPMAKWILPTDINLQKRMLLRPRIADRVGAS